LQGLGAFIQELKGSHKGRYVTNKSSTCYILSKENKENNGLEYNFTQLSQIPKTST
jgi:hypothetical protein